MHYAEQDVQPPESSCPIEVIATRDPGEYILKVGDKHYVELQGQRELRNFAQVAKLVTVPYWGWNLRKPETPYPCTSWEPDYDMDEPDKDNEDEE